MADTSRATTTTLLPSPPPQGGREQTVFAARGNSISTRCASAFLTGYALALAEQAAEVFKRAKPKLAVYSHIVTKELQGKKGEDQIIDRTRAAGYDGPLLMGVDRMVLEIAGDVKVLPPRSLDDLPNLDSKGQPFP